MSQAKAAQAKPGQATPGQAKPASVRPQLKSVKPVPKSRPRFRKLYFVSFVVGLIALVATPFAIVFLHASLLTGQRDLDNLRLELNEQLELRQQLLYERSQAASPELIRATATEVLGMVVAENVTYLNSSSNGQ